MSFLIPKNIYYVHDNMNFLVVGLCTSSIPGPLPSFQTFLLFPIFFDVIYMTHSGEVRMAQLEKGRKRACEHFSLLLNKVLRAALKSSATSFGDA